jgi:hypothetical protein
LGTILPGAVPPPEPTADPDLWRVANFPLIRGLPFGLIGTECYVDKAKDILSDGGGIDDWKQTVEQAGGKSGYVDWLLTDDEDVMLCNNTRYLCPVCSRKPGCQEIYI